MRSDYEAVIGLEVHCQLTTDSKIFCTCKVDHDAPPNTRICPVCAGFPGVLPVLNKKVVEYALKLAIAVSANIRRKSVFARKNYYYPDLPKGYQISQYELPIAEGGFVEIDGDDGIKRIRLKRIHMEEDAGKLVHGKGVSFVDLNRASVPLLEIVSEPDISSPKEASNYLKELRSILQYLEISTGDMEKGMFRCDANISVRKKGEKALGTRTELKNINSFRFIEKALEYEIERQISILEEGGEVVQETRLFDPSTGITKPMRGKEEAHDYRYFPDPDLVPLEIDDEWIERIKKEIPELPRERRGRFVAQYGLTEKDAMTLTSTKYLSEFFEETVSLYKGDPKKVSNWITTEFLKLLNRENIEAEDSKVKPSHIASILSMVDSGKINLNQAKSIFEEVFYEGKEPEDVVKEKGYEQITDAGSIEPIVKKVLESHPDEVKRYKGGKKGLLGFFVGQVMKETKGKANPKIVNELLRKYLDEE